MSSEYEISIGTQSFVIGLSLAIAGNYIDEEAMMKIRHNEGEKRNKWWRESGIKRKEGKRVSKKKGNEKRNREWKDKRTNLC